MQHREAAAIDVKTALVPRSCGQCGNTPESVVQDHVDRQTQTDIRVRHPQSPLWLS